MKRLLTIYEFELLSYIKNKSFMVTTILMVVILGVATFLPRFFDMSDFLGIEDSTKQESADEKQEEEIIRFGIVDEKGFFSEKSVLDQTFQDAEFIFMDNVKELKNAVTKEEIAAGFYVTDDMNYQYYVLNRDMSDENSYLFSEIMSSLHKKIYCEEQGIDYDSFVTGYEAEVQCEEKILGKDATENFWYCYALVIVIFMVIILYGVMIATSVTTEKSNRSIEILVTSVDSKYLLFGKVFAGTTAVMVQLGLILGVSIAGYGVNHELWGGKLDMLLDIPPSVLCAFVVFGIGGFLFYAFLYGAMGALVSKTEDINKSAGTLQMIITIVYLVVLFQLENPDGILMKVCSFLPFSSYSAMFVRIGMGKVEMWEIVVSALILFVSVFLSGCLAAKIYRMGTLRYGNPIKLGRALKDMQRAE